MRLTLTRLRYLPCGLHHMTHGIRQLGPLFPRPNPTRAFFCTGCGLRFTRLTDVFISSCLLVVCLNPSSNPMCSFKCSKNAMIAAHFHFCHGGLPINVMPHVSFRCIFHTQRTKGIELLVAVGEHKPFPLQFSIPFHLYKKL